MTTTNKRIIPLIILSAILVGTFVPATVHATTYNGTMGASVVSTSALNENISVAIPRNAFNISVLPFVSVAIYGQGGFNVTLNGQTIEVGVSTSQMQVNFSMPDNSTDNITIYLDGTVYSQMEDLHVRSVASFLAYQSAYIISTYPGQSQTLFASPQVGNNSQPQQMYPHWNITMISSYAQHYTIYVNGAFVSQGIVDGQKSVHYLVNASLGTAMVSIGNVLYKFPNLPVSQVPLRVKYQPPPPNKIYTQQFLNFFTVKVDIGLALTIVGVAVVVAPVTATKKDRSTV